ncbi:MAG: hypothetical protein DI598_02735 [Pseudopedobacter saltans]|uniref:Uncharacterized protein n=1 Tax=Pseudopedobacter saltans TaxID=151895 RepID=A0A2W5F890_9SPHI|nr:MAG: hypothetical protein DI598_02735 [Pseudopedobacter saltans]
MKMTLLTISLFWSCFVALGQSSYQKYCNTRFQFCIEYPSNFKAQPESANGDGCVIISNDGKSEIRTYGSLENEETNNLTQELQYAEKESKITYKIVCKNYFIISGTNKEGMIFYRKTVVAQLKDYFNSGPAKVLQTLTITYPKSQIKQYEDYCSKISKALL